MYYKSVKGGNLTFKWQDYRLVHSILDWIRHQTYIIAKCTIKRLAERFTACNDWSPRTNYWPHIPNGLNHLGHGINYSNATLISI